MTTVRLIKRILVAILLVIVAVSIWQYELVAYGMSQARGQLHVLLNTRPLNEVLQDPAFPDSLKQKIQLIQEIRRFAVDSLGINDTKNYTSLYDQHGKPILWVVTASEPYQLKAKEWEFPFLGTFSYKGFFDYEQCMKQESALKQQGYDTDISEVSAWSTLGWFRDPILSSMLYRSEGSLASLIIHELTHGTLFIKDNLEYNENLADFVGDYGALRFLHYKYGNQSTQYQQYLHRKIYRDKYYQHVLRGANRLDSLYASFRSTDSKSKKDRLKTEVIRSIMEAADTLTPLMPKPKISDSDTTLPNNAFFISYQTYRQKQNVFEQEFIHQFNRDFKKYFTYLKKTYPSM
jgi:predicted aminopeptidase